MNEPIDNPDLQPTQALVKADMPVASPPTPEPHVLTPQQARVEAVANVLHKAYEKASMLELTPEQVKALKADFPNEAFKKGAGGNLDLLYLEHPFLRDRFDEVIGMGQWALVRSRPHWGEEFITNQGKKAVRIYADCALLIKGCLVSEAIGEMVYYPNNPTQSYGDAAEGSETAAFRRCAKKIGVGLQAWKKDFCAEWMKQQQNPQAKTYPVHVKVEKPSLKPKPTPKFDEWLEACRAKLLELCKPVLPHAWIYAVREGWILPNEQLTAVTASKMFPHLSYFQRQGEPDELLINSNKEYVTKRKDEIMAGIQAVADGPRDEDMMQKFSEAYVASEPETPEPDLRPSSSTEDMPPQPDPDDPGEAGAEGETKMGEIVAVSVKHGTSARGKWTCYGIKIGEDWFNTFDTKLGKQLEAKKNQYVTIEYETTERGKTVLKLL